MNIPDSYPIHIPFILCFSRLVCALGRFSSTGPGVLPPVLCAPFDDPEDYDDIANGVPILHGLRSGGRAAAAIFAIFGAPRAPKFGRIPMVYGCLMDVDGRKKCGSFSGV